MISFLWVSVLVLTRRGCLCTQGSARIARYGKHTSVISRDKFKGKGPQPGDNIGGGRVYRGEDFEALRATQQQIAASYPTAATSPNYGEARGYDRSEGNGRGSFADDSGVPYGPPSLP